MIGNQRLFISLIISKNNVSLKIADSSISKVTRVNNVRISKDLILKLVLVKPSLSENLMSMRKRTNNEVCDVNFNDGGCIFQA